MALHDDRKEYTQGSLEDFLLHEDPISMFRTWLEAYRATGAADATAFALSTVSADGMPNARIVLLKELLDGELVFFTNYRSQKGQDLAVHPVAHALFFWPSMERQVRVQGSVRQISADESRAYFASRPLGSQWGAVASEQSQPTPDRASLDAQLAEVQRRFPESVPCPEHWGGYALKAARLEFWQGRASRMHDRLQFTLTSGGNWAAQRLQP